MIYYDTGGTTVSDISNTTIHSSSHSNKISDTQSDQELSGESQREYL